MWKKEGEEAKVRVGSMGIGGCRVGDYVDVVRGRYSGKSGYVIRLTLWKVEVRLACGSVVMINQSSVVKNVRPCEEENLIETEKERKMVLCTMVEAELLRVKRSVVVLEDLLRQLVISDENDH